MTETETETSTAPDIESLRTLLADVDTPPLEHAEALRHRREALVEDSETNAALDRLELLFLDRQAARRDVGVGVRSIVDRARVEALRRTSTRLEETPSDRPPAVFELAELRAAFLMHDCADEADIVKSGLAARIAHLPITPKLEEEARERYAAIMTDEEDLGLKHKIFLMHETADVMAALFAKTQSAKTLSAKTLSAKAESGGGPERVYARMARRLRRAAGDRGLYLRLERVLTRRGVVILETTSLLLLLVVFVLITVELTTTLTEDTARVFLLVDAAICTFFILEFLFKLALAPSRLSWFLRNMVTDLLPAIPAVLMLSTQFATLRLVRFFRLVQFARYMQGLRSILGFFRLLLFLVRGLDALVARFSHLINRNFVFFDPGTHRGTEALPEDPRRTIFQSLRREHVLLDDLPARETEATLIVRAEALTHRLRTHEEVVPDVTTPVTQNRDVPVEEAIEQLYQVRPDELGLTMNRSDLLALDRVTRVINAPIIRSIPFVHWFSSRDPGDTPEARVVSLGRRIADQLDRWRGRVLFMADLHGIVTGPQILDRVASAMVKASKRPATRLLMFGALFSIVRMFVSEKNFLNEFLGRFVATPLIVLGSVCFVILFLGTWLKRLAGEAALTLKRTSEAHFINLLELVKARTRDSDLVFLAERVFRFEMNPWEAALALGQQVEEASSVQIDLGDGHVPVKTPPDALREDLSRVAFLYMHFLDGAILHESDIKTTEQLLANLSLENIRKHHLNFSRRDHKRVRKLSLASGSILSGPYLWFRFITESVALETAKRITEYNRHCLTLQQQAVSTESEIAEMRAWMTKRVGQIEGRIIEKIDAPDSGALYRTTEFNSMDFLAVNERRDAQIERVFGLEVLDILRMDRRNMIRDIFGTRPLHKLPRSRRSVNFHRFFTNRLSRGRIFLVPIYFLGAIWWMLKNACSRTVGIVREITRPESANVKRESGRASFRVALRKIHRMKAPGLLEAMHMRACFDPAYCGAPPTWSFGTPMEEVPELQRDMHFLQMRERERAVMQSIAADNRRRVEQLHALVKKLDVFDGIFEGEGDECEMNRKLGERAMTIAYITDRGGMRSLFEAERWVERELPRFEDPGTRFKPSWMRALFQWIGRKCKKHPVRAFLETKLVDRRISRRGRRNMLRAWMRDIGATRRIVSAWLEIADDVAPATRARELAVVFYRANGEVSRELVALRAVQSLSVLDVRNYRDLVFQLGGYADDGEDPALSKALP